MDHVNEAAITSRSRRPGPTCAVRAPPGLRHVRRGQAQFTHAFSAGY